MNKDISWLNTYKHNKQRFYSAKSSVITISFEEGRLTHKMFKSPLGHREGKTMESSDTKRGEIVHILCWTGCWRWGTFFNQMYYIYASKGTLPNKLSECTWFAQYGKPMYKYTNQSISIQTCTFSPLYFRAEAKVTLGEGRGLGFILIVCCVVYILFIKSGIRCIFNGFLFKDINYYYEEN